MWIFRYLLSWSNKTDELTFTPLKHPKVWKNTHSYLQSLHFSPPLSMMPTFLQSPGLLQAGYNLPNCTLNMWISWMVLMTPPSYPFRSLPKEPNGRDDWSTSHLGNPPPNLNWTGEPPFDDISTTVLLLQSEAYLKFWHIYSRVLSAQARIKHWQYYTNRKRTRMIKTFTFLPILSSHSTRPENSTRQTGQSPAPSVCLETNSLKVKKSLP